VLQAYQFTTAQLSTHAFDSPTGLGAGLSFRTAAGLFQFVYSVGRSELLNTGFSLSNSKIHFGLTSRF
jgi:translocation and assembly module TamA